MLRIKIIILTSLVLISFGIYANDKANEKVGTITCFNDNGNTYQTKATATEYIILLSKQKGSEKCIFTPSK